MKIALAVLALLASVYTAHAFGIGREGALFGRLGNITAAKPAAVTPGCSGTGLIFSAACNSQYIGIL